MNIENGKHFSVRKAKKEDFFRIFQYVQTTIRPEDSQLSQDDFENFSVCDCIVAENLNKNIIGIVIYFPRFSTWIGRFLAVEFFYVEDDLQNREIIVEQLVKEISKEARKNKIKNIECSLLKRNPAKKYFKLLGAIKITEIDRYDAYHFNEESICKLVQM